MFSNWKLEKATLALVDAAQAMADKLTIAKPHVIDSHAAFAQFWASVHGAEGRDLHEMIHWQPAEIARFATMAEAKIAALRKQRDYDSSDGLAVWLHTARAVTEPRIAPAMRAIWRILSGAGPNAATMAEDMLQEAGLPAHPDRRIPAGFGDKDAA